MSAAGSEFHAAGLACEDARSLNSVRTAQPWDDVEYC